MIEKPSHCGSADRLIEIENSDWILATARILFFRRHSRFVGLIFWFCHGIVDEVIDFALINPSASANFQAVAIPHTHKTKNILNRKSDFHYSFIFV